MSSRPGNQLTKEQYTTLAIYVNEFLCRHVFQPGLVENSVMIIDMSNVGVLSLPLGLMRELGNMLEANYKARVFRTYIVNAPLILSLLYVFIKSRDIVIQKKLSVSRKPFAESMFSHISKAQLEKKYGGDKQNLEGQFWPPSCQNDFDVQVAPTTNAK